MQIADKGEVGRLSRNVLLLALVVLIVVDCIFRAGFTSFSIHIIFWRCGCTEGNKVSLDATSDIMRIHDFRQAAGLALLARSVEPWSIPVAINLDAGQFLSIEVGILGASVALAIGLIEQLSLRQHAELTLQSSIDKPLLSSTGITPSAFDIQYLVGFAGIALLQSEVEDASFWAIEADLLLILHEGCLDGAIGEIVSGCTFEEVDLVVANSGGAVVPIFGLQVALEVAVVEVDDTCRSLVAHPGGQAVLAVKSSVEVLDIVVG